MVDSTLVQNDFPEGYQAFMQINGISHFVIDMQGTKKTAISREIMNSIMKVALDQRNYPLLIHCNHGKV
jgi:tyrosine-protein phosphatase SIW14